MNDQIKAIPADPTDEPGYGRSWHFDGEYGIRAEEAWETGFTGSGITVGIVDDGFDLTDSDLTANFNASRSYDYADGDNYIHDSGTGSKEAHGTRVARFLVAADNGEGVVGSGFDVEWHGYRVGFSDMSTLSQGFRAGLNSSDILNNSWSLNYDSDFSHYPRINYSANFTEALSDGRDGLGQVVVFSAGNDRDTGVETTSHWLQNHLGTITVGAIGEDGDFADFSSRGSNLLVTAPGETVLLREEGNTAYFGSGTSYAAPLVSGVVAAMLEANENLGFRDVKEILAITSRRIDDGLATDGNTNDLSASDWVENGSGNWNGGGMIFSGDYGHGLVDMSAATRLAQNWIGQSTYDNMIQASRTIDNWGMAVSEIEMTISQDIELDMVDLSLDWNYHDFSEVSLYLVSPKGTESRLSHAQDHTGSLNWTYTSNAFWGESSSGVWRVEFRHAETGDAIEVTTEEAGINFYGDNASPDSVYYFTDEYGDRFNHDSAIRFITDLDGGEDTLNFASSGQNVVFSLKEGRGTSFDGAALEIAAGTIIENIITGEGSDRIWGNDEHNTIFTGRGDGEDLVFGFDGSDYIVTGGGDDTIAGGEGCDRIISGEGDDLVDGGGCDDRIMTGSGNDRVLGREGDDMVFAGGGADRIWGHDGDDTIKAGSGNDHISGGIGDDRLWGEAGWDYIRGGAGHDHISGGAGRDFLHGDDGDDRIYGGEGYDVMTGGSGNDKLDGGIGNDLLFGGVGNDRLDGGEGADHMYGGRGDDVYVVDNEGDRVREDNPSEGYDAVFITGTGSFDGGNGTELARIFDSAQNANLTMNAQNNAIWGNAYANRIDAAEGNDVVDAGRGNDTIAGGEGNDVLTGGLGADVFDFNEGAGHADEITDFTDGSDLIDITDLGIHTGGAISGGYISMIQNGSDVDLSYNPGGSSAAGYEICTLSDFDINLLSDADFIL
ncbi:S8 family serine peptidase [Sulfitobacter sp. R18_1]|uniref:S8 family serine peptidase n=1 Tax=Sulfitobacter sp. R18_1 TaxID=2821104 RepID=UPI001ADBD91F|nr:S8 family serine peptidase [Sulfitobacter sp. R18_1]MBO9428368.1 S8 family serine peptidase [Sulfitobacter sp. R18_1]